VSAPAKAHNNAVEHIAYVALGSNLGDRLGNLRDAIARLRQYGRVSRASSWYETEPIGVIDQPWFVNAVVELRTQAEPIALMKALLEIEHAMGRKRVQPKEPRNIDLDLLLYDDQTVNSDVLTLPHPALHERRFVLEPLAEIAPGALHPVLRKTALQLLETLSSPDEVHLLAER
jgi:2-amino-4-hydroxy-6-hydroxymethyldihydropteridine diphosphokinase